MIEKLTYDSDTVSQIEKITNKINEIIDTVNPCQHTELEDSLIFGDMDVCKKCHHVGFFKKQENQPKIEVVNRDYQSEGKAGDVTIIKSDLELSPDGENLQWKLPETQGNPGEVLKTNDNDLELKWEPSTEEDLETGDFSSNLWNPNRN